jgi:hypothetical protein
MLALCIRVTEQFCRGHGNFYPAVALLDHMINLVGEAVGAYPALHSTAADMLVPLGESAQEHDVRTATSFHERVDVSLPRNHSCIEERNQNQIRVVAARNLFTGPVELVQARFREVIRPPCQVVLRIERCSEDIDGLVFEIGAHIGSLLVADASIRLPRQGGRTSSSTQEAKRP